MNIVFAMTRYQYDSYTDFWKLVELAKFETCYVDEVDISKPNIYVVSPMNGEWDPHIANQAGKPHNAHLVHWCLERPSGAGGLYNYGKSNRFRIYDRTLDDVWVSDRQMGLETQFRFLPLGSDYGLGEPARDKVYDVVHMSYVSGRRANIYGQLDPKLLGPNGWGLSRHYVLQHSRFALNIHQDQFPFQEPLRWALFAAYGLPMLTEEVKDAYPWNEDICVFHPYDGIVGRMKEMINNDYDRWWDVGQRARDHMCKKFNFRKMVLQAVKEAGLK